MNYFNTGDVATYQGYDRIALKKSVNTKVNRNINFLLGLLLALLTVYLIIELNSQVIEKKAVTVNLRELPQEQNQGAYRIIENKPKKQQKIVKKSKPVQKQQKKFDVSKPPVIDDTVDDFDNQLAALEPTDDPITEPVVASPARDPSPTINETSTSHLNFVTEVPLFPGCSSNMSREEGIECLNSKMGRYVQRKFDTGMTENVGNNNVVKISVLFTIGVDGLPKDIQIKAPNKQLEEEALRVISRLPKMTPGKMNGAPVNVTYSLPIVYKVN